MTVSQKLSDKLAAPGKTILVANFTDLQNNQTELGRFVSEALSVELINTNLLVVDRSGKDAMLTELGYIDSLITIPEERRKFGQLHGVDYLVKGSMTLLDNSVDINIKVLDIYKGIMVAGIRSQLPRTDAINNLLRNNIGSSNGTPANQNIARKIDTHNKSPLDDLFEARASELRKGECVKPYFRETSFNGQLCFENQTGEDLIFYCEDFNPGVVRLDEYKMTLPNGTRNCSRLVVVNFDNLTQQFNEATSRQTSFVFSSMDGTKRCRQSFTIDRCVVKSFVLTDKNIVLLKN